MSIQSSLLQSKGGLNVQFNTKFLYSEYDPENSAVKGAVAVVKDLRIIPHTLYIIPSPALWYGVPEIISKLEGETVIAVECDPGLYDIAAAREHNLPLFPNNRISVNELKALPGWPFRRVQYLPLNSGYRFQKEAYSSLHTILSEQLMEYWRNRMTLAHMIPLWTRNLFKNLPEIQNAIPLNALRTEKPVILAGAGESLEQLREMIAGIREEYYILAIDTALPYFCEAGIQPDAVIAVDGQFYNFLDFVGDAVCPDMKLIADVTSYPGILRRFHGRTYVFMTDFWETSLVARMKRFIPDMLPAFGSVGIAGLEIAQRITSNSIFVCGLDFSFSLGKTHARGTTYGKYAERKLSRLSPIPAVKSQLVRGLTTVTTENGTSRLTDAALSGYCTLAANWPFDRSRIFTLSRSSRSIGLQFGTLQHGKSHAVDSPQSMNNTPSAGISEVTTFSRNENRLLTNLYNAAFDILQNGETQRRLNLFMEKLEECDYAALHITDMAPSKPHPTQLKRLLMALSLYIRTISRFGA